jgi:hypothetical protein
MTGYYRPALLTNISVGRTVELATLFDFPAGGTIIELLERWNVHFPFSKIEINLFDGINLAGGECSSVVDFPGFDNPLLCIFSQHPD